MHSLIHINLLDWRAARRSHKRKRFMGQLAAILTATALFAGVLPTLYYNQRISAQRMRNHYLKSQIGDAQKKIVAIRKLKENRMQLIDQVNAIVRLQQSRIASVHYFDQIVATLPDDVTLTRLAQTNGLSTLEGIAGSNNDISSYIARLNSSPWFGKAHLLGMKTTRDGRTSFSLDVESTHPAREHT